MAERLDPERGRLVIVDDFLTTERAAMRPEAVALVDRFQAGWRLGSLRTTTGCQDRAAAAGLELVDDRDLTPLLGLGRPRDRVIALIAPLLERMGLVGVPFCGNMIGGNALQQGLSSGVLAYRMLTFRRRDP